MSNPNRPVKYQWARSISETALNVNRAISGE